MLDGFEGVLFRSAGDAYLGSSLVKDGCEFKSYT